MKGGKETTQTKPKAIEKDDESAERTSQNPFEENADTASTNPFDEVEEEQPTTPTAKTRSTEVKQEASQDTSKTTETRKVHFLLSLSRFYLISRFTPSF